MSTTCPQRGLDPGRNARQRPTMLARVGVGRNHAGNNNERRRDAEHRLGDGGCRLTSGELLSLDCFSADSVSGRHYQAVAGEPGQACAAL